MFAWAKGNSRWVGALSSEVAALDPAAFPTVAALCDQVADMAQHRPWDSDYDEPTAARNGILEKIEAIRRATNR